MRISDIIEEFIKEMLDEENEAIIQRNDLANHFNCVPSQINYVIATRFTPTQGYYVESQRGGGGFIRIEKARMTKGDYVLHIIKSIDETLTAKEEEIIINNFLSQGIIDNSQARLIKSATNDKALKLSAGVKDKVRASIFKNMLLVLAQNYN